MTGKVLTLDQIITKDNLGCEIARMWMNWDMSRENWKSSKVELRKYIYATDTTTTTNAKLPWNNKTTIPKLCQIRDNLYANYMATMFPRRKWLVWEGSKSKDQDPQKEKAIKDYMSWLISQPWFKEAIGKLVYDYIDYGNVFPTTEWVDETTIDPETQDYKPGYVGPKIRRISPFDIVMNPTASSAGESPKIVRALMSLGEAKEEMERLSNTPEDKEVAEEVWKYLIENRRQSQQYTGEYKEVDEFFAVDGFDTFKRYLDSDMMELLYFYGNYFDKYSGKFYRNQMIVVADRYKVIYNKQLPLRTGDIPIRHAGWRLRQDNIWAMGPLDNLVGMQYRIDHIENLKADIFDLTVFPPLKVKGVVEDFEWGPFERIYVDGDGDVELMSPKADVLSANVEIQGYEQRMEEMAGAPKEAMGFRTPGEKTMYEVQSLENAASRIFSNKISQFEEQVLEPLINDMLALARDNLNNVTIRIIDDEFNSVGFRNLTREDLSAQGRLKPIAARHFAESAQVVQNLTNFFGGALGQDPDIRSHFSGIKLARLFEELLEIQDYELVQPYIRMAEQADASKLAQSLEEQVLMEAGVPAGVAPDDYNPNAAPSTPIDGQGASPAATPPSGPPGAPPIGGQPTGLVNG